MFRPEYNQLQNMALLLQKCVKISSGYFSLLYPKVRQVKCYNFLIYLIPPPPHTHTHISDCQHVFLMLFRISLRHLDGWLSIIQKFARDLISVDMVPDYYLDMKQNKKFTSGVFLTNLCTTCIWCLFPTDNVISVTKLSILQYVIIMY